MYSSTLFPLLLMVVMNAHVKNIKKCWLMAMPPYTYNKYHLYNPKKSLILFVDVWHLVHVYHTYHQFLAVRQLEYRDAVYHDDDD